MSARSAGNWYSGFGQATGQFVSTTSTFFPYALARLPRLVFSADSFKVLEMMRSLSGAEPEMWGPAIVGFGSMPYKYASGREIEWMEIAFSPRKANLTLYLTEGFDGYEEMLARLGKHKVSKACLYIRRLSDVDEEVLKEIIAASLRDTRSRN